MDGSQVDLKTRLLEPLENPFGLKVLPIVLGTLCNPCVLTSYFPSQK